MILLLLLYCRILAVWSVSYFYPRLKSIYVFIGSDVVEVNYRDRDRVKLGGQAVTVMRGELTS